MRKLLLMFLMTILPLMVMGEERGVFFNKKSYAYQPLPTYEQSKRFLPVPIYEEQEEWVNLYWEAWRIAFSHLQSPSSGSPFVSNWIDEALSPQIFQWDTHFMAMFGRYGNHIFPFINSHDNFYVSQHPDGMINRVINESDGTDHDWGQGPDNARAINPPLFGWAEVQTYMVTGDKSRLELVLSPLEHYVEWIENNRCGNDTPHHLYWSNGQASGMDNTPRDTGRPEPGDGWDCHSSIDHMGWIDMSTQMVMCYNDLSYICNELGYNSKADLYKEKALAIAARINKWLWDDEKGLYFDVTPTGDKTQWITAATFWPMLGGIASKEQCEKIVSNLTDPQLFWTRIPVPSLAKNQPGYNEMGCYWKGGVWAPTNYMIVEGLKKNGYTDLAIELTKRYLTALSEVYRKTHTLWEVYAPEMYAPASNASGLYMVEPDFVGWTGLGPISMLIETLIGIEMEAPENTIRWNITSTRKHGVRQLFFNGSRVDLIATPVDVGYEVLLRSEKAIRVEISVSGKVTVIDLPSSKYITRIIPYTVGRNESLN